MKNNKNKILSIIVLLLFVGSYSMPFFPQENCDMPKSNNSAMHCDMAGMDCCGTMTECVVVVMLPIVSAPINKVEQQKDLTVDYIISYTDILDRFEDFSSVKICDESYSLLVHTGFQTPLLI
jgi:hypothetical protein